MAPALRQPEKIERCVRYTGFVIFNLSKKQCPHDDKKARKFEITY